MLGRGPKFGTSRWTFRNGDAMAEIIIRLVTAGIDIWRSQQRKDPASFTSALRQQITQAPIAVPTLERVDRRVREPRGPTMRGAGGGADWETRGITEVLADFHVLARRGLEQMRWIRVTRALIRRSLKELLVQEIDDETGRNIARLLLTLVEDADDRNWQLLPAEIRVARLTPPQGPASLDVGIPGVAPVPLVTSTGYDTYVLVVDPGAVGGDPPTVLVDRLSRVDEP
jgi:hypothetical protein